MDSVHLAWLAGFIDGEGHVGAHYQSTVKGRDYWQVTCMIRNTHKPTMMHVKTLLEDCLDRKLTLHHETRVRGKDSYLTWTGKQRDLNILAKLLLPYTVTKKRQWELMLEHTDIRLQIKGYPRTYSERELEILQELSVINKRWTEG